VAYVSPALTPVPKPTAIAARKIRIHVLTLKAPLVRMMAMCVQRTSVMDSVHVYIFPTMLPVTTVSIAMVLIPAVGEPVQHMQVPPVLTMACFVTVLKVVKKRLISVPAVVTLALLP